MNMPAAAVPIAMMVGSMVLQQIMKPKTPDAPAIPAPTPPPQATKAPEYKAVKDMVAGRVGAGADATILTGVNGVESDTKLFGKNTILGA